MTGTLTFTQLILLPNIKYMALWTEFVEFMRVTNPNVVFIKSVVHPQLLPRPSSSPNPLLILSCCKLGRHSWPYSNKIGWIFQTRFYGGDKTWSLELLKDSSHSGKFTKYRTRMQRVWISLSGFAFISPFVALF